jgi:uncharacterized protein with von Willebrand factor type A (vWA) domain
MFRSNTALEVVSGSVLDISRKTDTTLAMAFLDVEYTVLIDTSGSMSERDARGGKTRYEAAIEELKALQAQNPGKILVINFSDSANICIGGIPAFLGGMTNLTDALKLALEYDDTDMTHVVISDGYPDSPYSALEVAKEFDGAIHTVFIGPENDRQGREFMAQLANVKHGKAVTTKSNLLAKNVQELLLLKSNNN